MMQEICEMAPPEILLRDKVERERERDIERMRYTNLLICHGPHNLEIYILTKDPYGGMGPKG